MRTLALATALVFSVVASPARCAVIDFSTLPQGNPPFTTYSEDGFEVDTIAGTFSGTSGNGAPPPSIYTPSNSGTVEVTNGGLFTFSAVSLGNGAFSGTAGFVIKGLRDQTTLFSETRQVGPFAFLGYDFAADSSFAIDSLEITVTGDGNIDNIDVTPYTAPTSVPEPASLALLGLGAVGWFATLRRRQR